MVCMNEILFIMNHKSIIKSIKSIINSIKIFYKFYKIQKIENHSQNRNYFMFYIKFSQ